MDKHVRKPQLILVASDELPIRQVLQYQLESAGFSVLAAPDGARAFELAISTRPDLVISDVRMPRSDGHDLLHRLREEPKTARIPFFFLTAMIDSDHRLAALQAGANDFITKPWEARELLLRVRNIIEWTQDSGTRFDRQLFFSCFISYSVADEAFAVRLHDRFLETGIESWKWNEDAITGKKLWAEIDWNIRKSDKLVLIASEASLSSPAVIREIERALCEEDDRAKLIISGKWQGTSDVLFPVRLDDYLFEGWEHERKRDVLQKVVADARGWQRDSEVFDSVVVRLIEHLRKDDTRGVS